MTGVVGAIVEAWDELRIHKLRVLLALIGVAVAVSAITGISALAGMLGQASTEFSERQGGRSATVQVNMFSNTGAANDLGPAATKAYAALIERYRIGWSSRMVWTQIGMRFPDSTQDVTVQAVDQSYGVMHRIVPTHGSWFVASDADRLAPALVVNEALLAKLGVTDLSSHPTVVLRGEQPIRATVVGVTKNAWEGDQPAAYMLYDSFVTWGARASQLGSSTPTLEVWVPPASVDEFIGTARHDLQAAVPGVQVQANRSDQGGTGVISGAVRWVVTGIGAVALLLGALGLVNISLVTVRYRIREIGIRRSFGASSSRVFFAVMMESVVATALAGAVGVGIAIGGVALVPLERLLGSPITDTPAFPVSAALLGLACATGVGALAGFIPALVAVRVKVIDAIRY